MNTQLHREQAPALYTPERARRDGDMSELDALLNQRLSFDPDDYDWNAADEAFGRAIIAGLIPPPLPSPEDETPLIVVPHCRRCGSTDVELGEWEVGQGYVDNSGIPESTVYEWAWKCADCGAIEDRAEYRREGTSSDHSGTTGTVLAA